MDPISLLRKAASLSLFCRYYFGQCCDELRDCIPAPFVLLCNACQGPFSHNNCVGVINSRTGSFNDNCFPSSSRLWNSSPVPLPWLLQSFFPQKVQVYRPSWPPHPTIARADKTPKAALSWPSNLTVRPGIAELVVCLPYTLVDGRSRLGLDDEALILLLPLEVRRQSNSTPATLKGCSSYDLWHRGLRKKSISPTLQTCKLSP